jgi:hypothetical protein
MLYIKIVTSNKIDCFYCTFKHAQKEYFSNGF